MKLQLAVVLALAALAAAELEKTDSATLLEKSDKISELKNLEKPIITKVEQKIEKPYFRDFTGSYFDRPIVREIPDFTSKPIYSHYHRAYLPEYREFSRFEKPIVREYPGIRSFNEPLEFFYRKRPVVSEFTDFKTFEKPIVREFSGAHSFETPLHSFKTFEKPIVREFSSHSFEKPIVREFSSHSFEKPIVRAHPVFEDSLESFYPKVPVTSEVSDLRIFEKPSLIESGPLSFLEKPTIREISDFKPYLESSVNYKTYSPKTFVEGDSSFIPSSKSYFDNFETVPSLYDDKLDTISYLRRPLSGVNIKSLPEESSFKYDSSYLPVSKTYVDKLETTPYFSKGFLDNLESGYVPASRSFLEKYEGSPIYSKLV